MSRSLTGASPEPRQSFAGVHVRHWIPELELRWSACRWSFAGELRWSACPPLEYVRWSACPHPSGPRQSFADSNHRHGCEGQWRPEDWTEDYVYGGQKKCSFKNPGAFKNHDPAKVLCSNRALQAGGEGAFMEMVLSGLTGASPEPRQSFAGVHVREPRRGFAGASPEPRWSACPGAALEPRQGVAGVHVREPRRGSPPRQWALWVPRLPVQRGAHVRRG